MSELTIVPDGGFSFLPGGLAYSQGVVASPGYAIEHIRFRRPVPVTEGFERIRAFLRQSLRPLSALCSVELRSPEPLSLNGFQEFNKRYAGVLAQWGLVRDDINAVARSNVAPVIAGPSEPSFFAFSVAVPTSSPERTFVVAGSSEWPEGGRFPEDIVRHGDTSPEALREKAKYVLQAMESRMTLLGVSWDHVTTTQSYSAYDLFDFLSDDVIRCGAGRAGVVWHYCRPPVIGWDFEMDVRSVQLDRILA